MSATALVKVLPICPDCGADVSFAFQKEPTNPAPVACPVCPWKGFSHRTLEQPAV